MANSTATAASLPDEIPVDTRTASPVVAFIIGLAIILLASILNAAGLNLTKLDHVRVAISPSFKANTYFLAAGTYKCNPKGCASQRLVTAALVVRNVIIYVWKPSDYSP